MRKRILKLMLAGLFVFCAFGVITLSLARATDGVGITITTLAGPIALDEFDVHTITPTYFSEVETVGLSDVYIVQVTIVPGGHSGWHSHPGPSIVTIISGTATFYHGDDDSHTPNVCAAGTGCVEESGRVHINRNEGDTDLVAVVMQIVPRGAPRRIDEPQPPGYCF
jgi:quercetin dioxygenase-like cupin family protein